jgi:hypothetical protein
LLNLEWAADHFQTENVGAINIILKKSSIFTNREKSLLKLTVLIEIRTESNIRDFNLVGEHLSGELPFFRLLLGGIDWQIILFKETNRAIGVADSEIFSVF